jgi:hypothetical protein
MRHPCRRSVVLAASSLLWTAGCGLPTTGAAEATASTRPAAKETCPDVVWNPPPSVPLVPSSRELVPFSPTLLGVSTTWAGDGFEVETTSGGYVDELTEAYDDLHVTASLSVAPDVEAEVLRGTFHDVPMLLVVWRDPAAEPPCDVRIFMITGADPATEAELLSGLQ